MKWDLGKTQTLLLGILLAAAIGISIPGGVDFVVYHFAAVQSAKDPAGVYTLPAPSGGYYYYGPIFLALIAPLSVLSYTAAKVLWVGLLGLAFIFIWRSFKTLYPTLFKNTLLWLWAFIFAINSIHSNFQSLNIQLLLLALLIATELLCEQGSLGAKFCAGLLCALAASIKVYPAFLLLFHWITEGRKFRAGAILGVLACIALPFAIFGYGAAYTYWTGFISGLIAFSSRNSMIQIADLLSLPTLLYRLTITFGWPPLVYRFLLLAIGGTLALSFLGWVSLRQTKKGWNRETRRGYWSMALALMVFLNPSSYTHYFVFYLPLLFWFLNSVAAEGTSAWLETTVVLLCTAFMAFSTDFVVGVQLNDQLEKWNLPTYAVLLMMATIALHLLRRPTTTPA